MQGRVLLGVLLLVAVSSGTGGHAFAAKNDINDIKAEIVKTRKLVEYRKTPAVMHLEHQGGGFPVLPDELEDSYNGKVDVLMVDPALEDFHRVSPNPMESMPGNYVFTITPKTACGYRVWADVKPRAGDRQFAMTNLPGAQDCKGKDIDRAFSKEDQSGHYKFKIEIDGNSLQVGQDATIKLTVRDDGGRYIDELQPIMGAYGQLVGFYDDYETIALFDPLGGLPTSYTDVGGPLLRFHIKPEKAGFMKIFSQFKINDRIVTASFALGVQPEAQAFVPPPAQQEQPGADKVADTDDEDKDRPSAGKKAEPDDLGKMLAATVSHKKEKDKGDLSDLYDAPEEKGKTQIYEDPDQKVFEQERLKSKADGDDPGRLQPVGQF